MARGSLANVPEDVVDQVLQDEKDTSLVEEDEATPPYVLIGDASIPVSKKAGKRWHKMIDEAHAVYASQHESWNRTFAYYTSTTDQETILDDDSGRVSKRADVDENLIRENVKLLLRSTYTRNPKIELSSTDAGQKPLAKVCELSLQALLNRKSAPGLNAKARIRRQIVHGHLTNFGVLKLDYQERSGSRQEALQQLERLREKASSSETKEDALDEVYAELEQVEEFLPLTRNSGMSLANILPMNLIVDPNATNYDLSDAMWVAEIFHLDEDYIISRYYEPGEAGEHVRKSDGKLVRPRDYNSSGRDEIQDKVVSQVDNYTSSERLEFLGRGKVKCYLVWDKLTRSIMLFSDRDWDYPLWVYEDYLKLSRFFPYFVVGYTEPVDGIVQAGEPAQYMGQIREINKINRKISYVRRVAFGALIYNSKVIKGDTAERLVKHLENPEEVRSFGVDWDPEVKIEDILQSFVPPVAKYQELFDTSNLLRVVNRASATNEALRGEQFRTNTTNQAINTYNQAANIVTNELTDVVEDAVEELAWAMCELLVSKYDQEDIVALIGELAATEFQAMTVEEFNARFSLVVAAGSTEKPSSEVKKQEALQIAQSLGQIGQAAPMTTMKIMSRMFSEAFSEFLVTDEDWKSFEEEVKATMARGQSAPVAGQPM